MTPDDAIALYRVERAKSRARNAFARSTHLALVARIVARADSSLAVVGANGKRRGRGILIPRRDPLDLLPEPERRP